MNPIFLDTSYLLALEIINDQNHLVASKHWRGLAAFGLSLVTTSYVFDETVTFFNSRKLHAKAIEVGDTLLRSPSISMTFVDEDSFHEGWLLLQQQRDKDYSLTDCISFVTMKSLGIHTALTFDKHFVQAGFKILP
jgi:predicted nucleic acid-binding protein